MRRSGVRSPSAPPLRAPENTNDIKYIAPNFPIGANEKVPNRFRIGADAWLSSVSRRGWHRIPKRGDGERQSAATLFIKFFGITRLWPLLPSSGRMPSPVEQTSAEDARALHQLRR